jgi:hypothetical protein
MSYDNNDFCGCTYGKPAKKAYTFYAVASDADLTKARWYRTYSSNKGSGFVNDIDDAKIWMKRSQAQSKCTRLGGSTVMVEFITTEVNTIDQTEHRKRAAEKKRFDEERRRQTQAERELADAERALKIAQEKINRLKG